MWFFSSVLPTKILYVHLFFPTHSTCAAHPICLDLFVLMVFCKKYETWRLSRDLGFRREVGEKCALLCYYAASSGISYRRFGTTYRSHLQGSRIQNPEERCSREASRYALSPAFSCCSLFDSSVFLKDVVLEHSQLVSLSVLRATMSDIQKKSQEN